MPDYEFYEGASTGAQIDESVQKGIVVVDCGTVSSLPFTKANSNILASHVVLKAELGTPAAMGSNWTVTTSGSPSSGLTIEGTLNRSTTLKLYLGRAAQSV